MTEYRVQVIDRTTGDEDFHIVAAESEQAAYANAAEAGWIVGKIDKGRKLKPAKPAPANKKMASRADLTAFFSLLLIVASMLCLLAAWQMDTTVGKTHNIGLISNREIAMGVARTLLTCSVMAYFGAKIVDRIDRLIRLSK